MFKKIIMYLLAIVSFTIFAMEQKEVVLNIDCSNWLDVFNYYKIKLPPYEDFKKITQNDQENLIGYWYQQIKHLKNPKELDKKAFSKIVFLKITHDMFPNYQKIKVLSDYPDFQNWLAINDQQELNAFGKAVCQLPTSYYYLINEQKIEFYYDTWASWYMHIEDLNSRRLYVDMYQKLLNMDLYLLKNKFLHPGEFLNTIMRPICKEDPNLKKAFLEKFVDAFLNSSYAPNKENKAFFIYAYCYFFNSIFTPQNSGISQDDRAGLVKKFPNSTQKLEGNILYDKKDVISILFDSTNSINQKKQDIVSYIETFSSIDKDDLNYLLELIKYNCINELISLYEDDLNGLNTFFEKIFLVLKMSTFDYSSLQSAVLKKLGEANYEIKENRIIKRQKSKPAEKIIKKPIEKSITIEKQPKSFSLANMIQDSKRYPNPFDKVLSGYDNAFKNTYKKVLLYEGKSDEELNYNTSLKQILQITDEKLKRNEITDLEKNLLFAYFVDAIVKHPQESIKNISGLNQFLNDETNGFNLKVKKELADILCVPSTDFYWYVDSDNKKIMLAQSVIAQKYRDMPDQQRSEFIKNYIAFTNYGTILKRFLNVVGFTHALDQLKLSGDEVEKFLEEYIKAFCVFNKKTFVFGSCSFFTKLLSLFSLKEDQKENLLNLLIAPTYGTFYVDTLNVSDIRDFMSPITQKNAVKDFINAIKKDKSLPAGFDALISAYATGILGLDVIIPKLVGFLELDGNFLETVNTFLQALTFIPNKQAMYTTFVQAIQKKLETFDILTELQVYKNKDNNTYFKLISRKGKKNNDLLAVFNKYLLSNVAQGKHDRVFKYGKYQWAELFKELPIILAQFKNANEEKDIAFQNLLIDIVNNCIAENIDVNISLVQEIIKLNTLDFDIRLELGNYFCQENSTFYLILNEESVLTLKKSPFAVTYMKIKDIKVRSELHARLNFIKKDNKVVIKNMITWAANPNLFKQEILDLVEDDGLKIDLLKICIQNFNQKSENLFLFGYLKFFNSIMFDALNIKDSSIVNALVSLMTLYQIKVKNLDGGKFALEDDADFLSMRLNNKSTYNDINKFINALKLLDAKQIQSMQSAFLQSVDLKKQIVYFLVPLGPTDISALENFNAFLRIVYQYTRGVKIDINDSLYLKEDVLKKDLENVLRDLKDTRPILENVECAVLGDVGNATSRYIQLILKDSQKPQENLSNLAPSAVPLQSQVSKVPITVPIALSVSQEQQKVPEQPISPVKQNSQDLSLPQGGSLPEVQVVQKKNASVSLQKEQSNNPQVKPKPQQKQNPPVQGGGPSTSGGWSGWDILKAIGSAIGSFFAWPFVKLWALFNG